MQRTQGCVVRGPEEVGGSQELSVGPGVGCPRSIQRETSRGQEDVPFWSLGRDMAGDGNLGVLRLELVCKSMCLERL